MNAEETRRFLERHLPRTLHHLGVIREGEAERVERVPGGVLLQSGAFYSLFAEEEAVAEALVDMIPWDDAVGFSALSSELVKRVVSRGTVSWRGRFWLLYLPTHVRTAVPPPTVRPLQLDDARIVQEHWPYAGPSSLEHIARRIRRGPTAAIQVDGTLAAWALTHSDGAMGFLHVMEEHRRKGLATALTSSLVSEIRSRGTTPFVYVSTDNAPSLALAEGLGMVRVERVEWMMLNKR